MQAIPTELFQSKPGTMNGFIFANPNIGLAPTLFYTIRIPLRPFDSGIDYEDQPVETEFSLEWLVLPVRDWRELSNKSFDLSSDEQDCSIYLGCAHNPVEIRSLRFNRTGSLLLQAQCTLFCDFEFEGVGKSATLEVTVDLAFEGLAAESSIINPHADEKGIRDKLAQFVEPVAYDLTPGRSSYYSSDYVWFNAKAE